jgi:hypothetical protein
MLTDRFERAVAAIDAANAADPSAVHVRGRQWPLAQAHGVIAADWVATLHPDAEETWRLAARAHHLRRWELPRADYPAGRAGYLRWKRDQRRRHADDVAGLLLAIGYDPAPIERVQSLVRRDNLATDAGAQAVEDGACLAFVETQLADVATRLDRDHLVDILRKTARKMSPAALDALASMQLGDPERSVLDEAFGQPG